MYDNQNPEYEEADIHNIPSLEYATKNDKLEFLDHVVDVALEKMKETSKNKVRITFRDFDGVYVFHELFLKHDYRRRIFKKFTGSITLQILPRPDAKPYVEFTKK